MDFASAFNDEEARCSIDRTNNNHKSSVIPPAKGDTHDHHSLNHYESLMLDNSIHTIGLNYDSVEHQLSVLERDSDDLFDSLLGTKRKQNSSSSLLVPLQESTAFPITKSLRRNSTSFNFNEDLGYNDIDNLFMTEDTVSGRTSTSEFTSDFSSSILVSKESTGPRRDSKKNKKPTAEAMHAFNQEYEARLNDLRQCMSRTKSSRSRVAKLKQVMKQRYLNKYSYRNNKLAKSIGINTASTDYSKQKLLQSQMYLNQVSDTSLLRTTDESSRHSSRSNTPSSNDIFTLK
ncbi:predicted protein [Chaetoceros tenuissimus]|uniref:Uncharacterized protein n=1 Tax=Chaetoceros tenuissimus TaxID=426638 RepID=A0AAD3CLC3_9STRA|nr:predicted protein [Chaetoceros tenuissimus]